jgi:hypothetical protein
MLKIINFLKWLFANPFTKCDCQGCKNNMSGWETEEYKREYNCTRRLI